jgi:hypothetical protein
MNIVYQKISSTDAINADTDRAAKTKQLNTYLLADRTVMN